MGYPVKLLPMLQAEIAGSEARSASQAAALKEQEAHLKAKEQEVETRQAGLNKQMQEVDKKGRELDALNRRYEKAMADVPKGEDAGVQNTRHICKQRDDTICNLPQPQRVSSACECKVTCSHMRAYEHPPAVLCGMLPKKI